MSSVTGIQADVERVPMLSLDEELGQLRKIAVRLGGTVEEEMIRGSILRISLYCRQMRETHVQEVAQLRDEIQILHAMVGQRSRQQDTNSWRSQLQGRATLEDRIRAVLDEGGMCTAVFVPIPSPLAGQIESSEMSRFLAEIQSNSVDGLAALWTSKLAVVLYVDRREQEHRQTLVETFRLGEANYMVRARAWVVVSAAEERSVDFLRRMEDRVRGTNAS